MKKVLNLLLMLGSVSIGQLAVQAQTAGAIGGTVVDSSGSVVPNATVTATNQSGKEFTVNTSENGTFRIPAVPSGIYSVSVTATRFKTTMVTNVKVDAGVPRITALALGVNTSSSKRPRLLSGGGWTILPTIRWQSGSPFSLGNVQLVGMTRSELQKEIKSAKARMW